MAVLPQPDRFLAAGNGGGLAAAGVEGRARLRQRVAQTGELRAQALPLLGRFLVVCRLDPLLEKDSNVRNSV